MRAWTLVIIPVLAALASSCRPGAPDLQPGTVAPGAADAPAVPVIRMIAEDTLPHDPESFTQGLAFHDGLLYETSGGYGSSVLMVWTPDLETVVARRTLPDSVFAEGLAFVGDTVYVLTWLEQTVFLFLAPGLEPLGTMSYEGEGWGLAGTGDGLIMSNGTGTLAWRDPSDFSVTRLLEVTLDGSPVSFLNELELVDGTLYANLWTSSLIAAIDTASGEVMALYSAEGLLSPAELSAADVLNGIALEPSTGSLLVTGKLWPRAFLVDTEGDR